MSLTSYLTDPEHQELRDKFKTHFPRPAFVFQKPLLAPSLTQNYGIIGTAFDYLLRFLIQFHNKEKYIDNSWVADIAFPKLLRKFQKEEQSNITKRYNRAKENHKKYIINGKLSNNLLADTLFLAKLDLYFRIGYIAPDLLIENNLDIKDLRALFSAINHNDFIAKEICYVNPTFGIGSLMVGGADADIILDDTIIDIKVTKHLKLERDYLNQTIGYCVLALIGGINKNKEGTTIKNIGVYFARHGFLWKAPLTDFCELNKIQDFKNWFVQYFDKIKNQSS